MQKIITELSENTMAGAIYKNPQGKLLICKTPHSNGKWSFPTVVTNTSKTVVKFIESLFLTEFGLDLQIVDYYETTRTQWKMGSTYKMFNFLCYDFIEPVPYIGQPDLTPTPSGDYTNISYKTPAEIIDLYENCQFEDSSMYYLLRYKNRYGV
ncbi:MAG: hypothetical protein ACRCX2_15600 [Paraclostridium sp.]